MNGLGSMLGSFIPSFKEQGPDLSSQPDAAPSGKANGAAKIDEKPKAAAPKPQPSIGSRIAKAAEKIKECEDGIAKAKADYQTKLAKRPEIAANRKDELVRQLAMRVQRCRTHVKWHELNLEQKKAELAKLPDVYESSFANEIAEVMQKGIKGYSCQMTISMITRERNNYSGQVLDPIQRKIKQLEDQKSAFEKEKKKLEENPQAVEAEKDAKKKEAEPASQATAKKASEKDKAKENDKSKDLPDAAPATAPQPTLESRIEKASQQIKECEEALAKAQADYLKKIKQLEAQKEAFESEKRKLEEQQAQAKKS